MRRRFRDNLLGVNCGALTGLGTLSPLPATLESSPVTWESLLPGGLESEPCWVEGLGNLKPQLGRGGGGMWGLRYWTIRGIHEEVILMLISESKVKVKSLSHVRLFVTP